MSVQKILGWSALLYGGATALSIAGFTLWAVMAFMLMAGMGWVLTLATVNITIQMECDPAYLARVVAINNMGAFGGLALGSWVWGLMTDWAGLHISIGLAGLSTCATALLYLVFPLPSEAGRAHRMDA